MDYGDPTNPKVVAHAALDLDGHKLTDIELCPDAGYVIVGYGADDLVSDGGVRLYSTVQRSNPMAPKLLHEFNVGPLPDMVKPSHDCSMIAVGNEGEGKHESSLVDPSGSLHLIRGLPNNPEAVKLSFDSLGTDEELIKKGVHLPLSKKAMEYWDLHSDIAADVDFSDARANYKPSMNLEPEYLAWSSDDSKLYINLQENNALLTVNVDAKTQTPTISRIDSYGLKDWSSSGGTSGLDWVKDDACLLKHYEGAKSIRMPDGIHLVTVDGVDYILTGNEGDDKEYGEFAEKQKMKDLLKQTGIALSEQAAANIAAHTAAGADASRRVTVGSEAVDYSDPTAPVLHDIISIGGRGISIFKPTNKGLILVWDSGSSLEKEGCAAFPWAHNSINDEEFAAVDGTFYNSTTEDIQDAIKDMNDPEEDGCVDRGDGKPGACPMGKTVDERSPKDGPSAEIVTAGVACGRLLAVTAAEKSGVAYVYDISKISSPKLLFVKHLSEASKTLSPELAYGSRTLGDLDSEQIIFLEKKYSPSGKAAVIFMGAWSGTSSFYEFTCKDDDILV